MDFNRAILGNYDNLAVNWSVCQDSFNFNNGAQQQPIMSFSSGSSENPSTGSVVQSFQGLQPSTDASMIPSTSYYPGLCYRSVPTSARKRKHNINDGGSKRKANEEAMVSKLSRMSIEMDCSTAAAQEPISPPYVVEEPSEEEPAVNSWRNLISNRDNKTYRGVWTGHNGIMIEEVTSDEDEDDCDKTLDKNGNDCDYQMSGVLKDHLKKQNGNILPKNIMEKILEPQVCRDIVLWKPPGDVFHELMRSNLAQTSSSNTSNKHSSESQSTSNTSTSPCSSSSFPDIISSSEQYDSMDLETLPPLPPSPTSSSYEVEMDS